MKTVVVLEDELSHLHAATAILTLIAKDCGFSDSSDHFRNLASWFP